MNGKGIKINIFNKISFKILKSSLIFFDQQKCLGGDDYCEDDKGGLDR